MDDKPRSRQRDIEILQRILDTRGGFGHREHIELAWTYLGLYTVDNAQRAVRDGIRHVAKLHGAPDKYHETITRSWTHLVAVHRAHGDGDSFDEFIAANPGLLDRQLLGRHFSRELIGSPEARARWLGPDVRELPLLPVG
jgi:hypothetical protein